MRVLVTGAAGFLGYHLARSLADENVELVLVDNFLRGEPDKAFRQLLMRAGIEFLRGDLCDPRFASAIAGDYDIIFHLAALNGTGNFYSRPWDVLRNSTLPTLNVLEIVRTGRCRRFVYAGSSESYAGAVQNGWPVPTAEEVPLMVSDVENPRWSYAAGKLMGEVAVVNACRDTRCDWTILRYHNVYGPRMGDDGHFVPEFLRRALRDEFCVYGPRQTRAFMYVDDAISATRALAEIPGAANQVINVGSEIEVRISSMAREMMSILGVEDRQMEYRSAPNGSVARRVPNLQKLHSLLPNNRVTAIEEGLQRTVEYYRNLSL